MLNLLQVQNTCERLAVRHWPQQEVSVYAVTKDCIATYLPRRARFRKPGTDTMDMIGDHLAVTSWRWKLGFSTLRDHFFFIFREQTHNPQSLRRQLQGPALWKNNKKQCGRAASWQNPTTSYLCIQKTLQCHTRAKRSQSGRWFWFHKERQVPEESLERHFTGHWR